MPLAHNLFYMTPARDLTPARNLTPWPLHVALVQLNSIYGVESIKHLFTVSPKAQLLQSAKDL